MCCLELKHGIIKQTLNKGTKQNWLLGGCIDFWLLVTYAFVKGVYPFRIPFSVIGQVFVLALKLKGEKKSISIFHVGAKNTHEGFVLT